MAHFSIQISDSHVDQISSNELVASIYKHLFQFDYVALKKNLSEDFEASVVNLTDPKDGMIATLSITHPNSLDKLPSEVLFNFECPDGLKASRVVEIGKLAKKPVTNCLEVEHPHITLLLLLKGVMYYAQSEGIEYWTATLHPYLASILIEIKFPFYTLYKGLPIVNQGNVDLIKYTGSYGQQDLIYAYYPIKESIRVLERFATDNLFTITDKIRRHV